MFVCPIGNSSNYKSALQCLFIVLLATIHQQVVLGDNEQSVAKMITSRGFQFEQYDIISPQNYILKAYRLINPLANRSRLHRVPVIGAPGLSLDITFMFTASKNSKPRRPLANERVSLHSLESGQDDRSLFFHLSNNNYDVWLIEQRGATPEVGERLFENNRDINRDDFWDFSLDEQALIDLPIQIDYVRRKTGAQKVGFIGYSHSTTLMFALLSMQPEFGDKLANFIAMAPVAFNKHAKGLIYLAAKLRSMQTLSTANSIHVEWFRRLFNLAMTNVCPINLIKQTLCKGLWDALGGPNQRAQYEGSIIESPFKQTSLKTLLQYWQNQKSGDFRMFDFGSDEKNMERYGQTVPPAYNVSQIRLRTMAFFRGTNDFMSDPADQALLISRLSVPLYEDHVLDGYGHMGFLISPTVVRDINEPILRILDETTGRTVYRVRNTLAEPHSSNDQIYNSITASATQKGKRCASREEKQCLSERVAPFASAARPIR